MRALALVLTLAACTGGAVVDLRGEGERVEIGGDVFSVERQGRTATVRNFSTGIANQGRLFRNAEAAVVMATGCDVESLTQRQGVNTYDARLAC
ncbi:hypothetical protein [Wenxinia marina]|uniref:Lipoprotein n=1 Tax=Wenxinia marina DSM 24838 TaxID=1123501 RepID=A0A0D0NHI4_9RHOB|nr:hypothetical protein [Wenxinia marina]KIQ67790.1 hypothetical protein Wenmar_03519 [Wenxinia marina DSM 24838]GGL75031.1 hypothetical protein GCM10011392_32080 [Wenxinia marina]